MDFIEEMQTFTIWLETNPLEPSAQTLWMHLMVLANKSGYPEWFAVRNPLLQAKVGISENTLKKHRNILIQKGRIEYKDMGKQQAGKYRMLTLTANIAVNPAVNCAVSYAVKDAVNPAVSDPLYKDFKDLKDLNSTATAATTREETFAKAHERVWKRSLTPFQNDHLGQYIDNEHFEQAVIIRAIERAALNGTGYKFGLITKILNDYAASGAKTLEAAEALDDQFEANRGEQNRRKEEGQHAKYGGRSENDKHGRAQAESEFAFLDNQVRTGSGI